MRRVGLIAAVALLLIASGARSARTASAGVAWCYDDPVLVINGQVVHITIGVEADRSAVTSSLLTVTVPANVDAHLSGVNNGGAAIGKLNTVVALVPGPAVTGASIPVMVSATVNATSSFPVSLTVDQRPSGAPLGTKTGTTGVPVFTGFNLP
jgi:hypothetical protein